MAPLIEMIRNDYKGVIVSRENLCSETIYEVGEVNVKGEAHLLLYHTSGIGNSCKYVSNLLVFKEGVFLGFYRTDLLYKFTLKKGKLLAQPEREMEVPYTNDFAPGLPDKLQLWANRSFKKAPEYEKN